MGLFGAMIGGAIGFAMGGPIGAGIGAVLCGSGDNNKKEDGIVVICPHCKEKVKIESEGEWICLHCKGEFTYGETSQKPIEKKIGVVCPYCNENVRIDGDGEWICPYCDKTFIYGENSEERVQKILFSIFAKFSKLNGTIESEHIKIIEKLIKVEFEYSPEERKKAIESFREAKDSQRSFTDYCYEFKSIIDTVDQKRARDEIYEATIDSLYQIANRNNNISNHEEQSIDLAGRIFEMSEIELKKLKDFYMVSRDELEKYYKILECTRGDSFEKVKSNYKKLVREYHPDRIASLNIPEYLIQHSNEKFREIQEAYDNIKNNF